MKIEKFLCCFDVCALCTNFIPSGGNRVERSIKGAHEGSIFSIFVQKDGAIITGGKDGRIVQWTRDLRKTANEILVRGPKKGREEEGREEKGKM